MKKLFALVTLLAFLAASCGKKKDAPAAAGSGSAPATGSATASPAPSPSPADPARDAVATANAATVELFAKPSPGNVRAERAGKVIDRLVEVNKTVQRTWDPATVVASAGKDRGALFKWVRDQTALVPYKGALRGAIGVMMDRVGNSLDRALLLADLLALTGLTVRLANATLPPDVEQKLAASWAARARPALPAGGLDDAALEAKLVTDFGVDPAAFAERAKKTAAAGKALEDALRARIAAQTKAVAGLVPGAAAVPAPASFADHWWVQVEDEGVWQDLDPSLPTAEPGQALAPAGETVAPGALADDHRHTLTVRVVGEVWKGTAREETTLLEHTLAPASYYGQPILLTNIPIDIPDQDALLASKDPAAAARAALLTQTEWVPVLRIGKSLVAKMSVTDGGELFDVSAADANTTRMARAVQRATKQGVGGANDLLDTMPDQAGSDSAPLPALVDHSAFTAEWIEIERRSPGEAPAITRRLVFDVLGAKGDRATARPVKLTETARIDRGLALGGQTEILPMFARIPRAFVSDRAVKALVEARPALVELAGLDGRPPSRELRDRLHQISSLPGPLYDLALARFAWSAVGDQVYLDRLDVFARHQRIVATSTRYVMRDGFDIITNSVGVWPASGRDARAVRIAQGVADTVTESGVLDCTTRTSCVRSANTSEDFVASSGKGWRVVQPAEASASVPAGARSDLAAGYAVIVGPAATWWRVHPQSGDTLGMSTRGGSVTTERVMMQNLVLFTFGAGACLYLDSGRATGTAHTRSYWACIAGALLGFAGASFVAGVGGVAVEGAVASRGLAFVVSLFGTLWGAASTHVPHAPAPP